MTDFDHQFKDRARMEQFLALLKFVWEGSGPLAFALFIVSTALLFLLGKQPLLAPSIEKYREQLLILCFISLCCWLAQLFSWIWPKMLDLWEDSVADRYDTELLNELGEYERIILAELYASRKRCQIIVTEKSKMPLVDSLVSKGLLYERHNQVCMPKKLWKHMEDSPWAVANFEVLIYSAINKRDYSLAKELRRDRELVRHSERSKEECKHHTPNPQAQQQLEKSFQQLKADYEQQYGPDNDPRISI